MEETPGCESRPPQVFDCRSMPRKPVGAPPKGRWSHPCMRPSERRFKGFNHGIKYPTLLRTKVTEIWGTAHCIRTWPSICREVQAGLTSFQDKQSIFMPQEQSLEHIRKATFQACSVQTARGLKCTRHSCTQYVVVLAYSTIGSFAKNEDGREVIATGVLRA
eukprot:scaffold2868_cov348-Pavlova_lutheri.AAC.2